MYTAIVPESGFSEAGEFQVPSFGDGKSILKLTGVVFSEMVIRSLGGIEW